MMMNRNQSRITTFLALLAVLALVGACSSKNASAPKTQIASSIVPNNPGVVNCTPNPGAAAYPMGVVYAGTAATIHFIGWGMCDYRFSVIGFNPISVNGALDIQDTFPTAGSNITKTYQVQLVDANGSAVAGVNVVQVTFGPITVQTPPSGGGGTTQPPAPPTCTIIRVVGSPTLNENQRVMTVQLLAAGGPATAAGINGVNVVPATNFALNATSYPHYEARGFIAGPGGYAFCDYIVDAPYCAMQVNAVTPTGVNTTLGFVGPVNAIKVQNNPQTVPQAAPWSVNVVESFTGQYAAWNRTTTGYVASAGGDSFNCPISYQVPALVRPTPNFTSGHLPFTFNANTDFNLLATNPTLVATGFGAGGAIPYWIMYGRTMDYAVATGNFLAVNPAYGGQVYCRPAGQSQDAVMVGHAAAGHGNICAVMQPWLRMLNGTAHRFNWDFNRNLQCPGNKVLYGLSYLANGQNGCAYGNGCRDLMCADIVVVPGI